MDPNQAHLCLHYSSPSVDWSQALPLGNGRLGCMVHGRTTTELLQLNEDSVWYGGPQDRTPRSAEHLPRLRQLIRDGLHGEAEELVRDEFFSNPGSMRHYEPLGSVYLEFGHASTDIQGYKRWLDIGNSMSTVTYETNGTSIRREIIASFPDNVLVMRVTASQKLRFAVRLGRRSENEWDTNEFFDSLKFDKQDPASARIFMEATPGGESSNRLCCIAGVKCDPSKGNVAVAGTCIKVEATECLIVVAAHTTFRHKDPEAVAVNDTDKALSCTWQELLSRHVADYHELFGRTNLRLYPDHKERETDIRISQRDDRDVGLIALYHSYGRYLLISSSRDMPQALPANLQGIWNPSFSPPWGSKYTININIQMNYWPVVTSNLMGCALPLVDLLERMAARGKRTARLMYGCSGWCAHHNTDIWADTDPQDSWMPATLWPLGGLWLCIDAVQMLQYRYDKAIHERLLPILEGCMEFLHGFLQPAVDERHLVTSPSLSPENTYVSESGDLGIFCEGSAIDMTIIKTAFELYLWSVRFLEVQRPMEGLVEEMLARIPPLQINDSGLIQEWGAKDYKEHEPGHRHVSHLFGLYPGTAIDTAKSPKLAEAARRVLARRAEHGGGHTGWSRAWLLNMHARLGDAEGCGKHMELLLSKSTLPNLLDNHPPFQIDGNFGGCAGIIECVVQSSETREPWLAGGHEVEIRLLPACPRSWSAGEVSGVCVRGGWVISFKWDQGKVIEPVLLQCTQVECIQAHLMFPDGELALVEGLGEHRVFRPDNVASEQSANSL